MNDDSTTDAVLRFLDNRSNVGQITREQARLQKTAVKKISSAREGSEPDQAAWMLKNLDVLKVRLENDAKSTTTRTYRSRAFTALTAFLKFTADPMRFGANASATVRAPMQTRACGLGGGREFRYELPVGGLTRKDIERISTHLWATAEDFDGSPFHPFQTRLDL